MPYILPEDREQYDKVIRELPYIHDEGHLNYVISRILATSVSTQAHETKMGYAFYNRIVGVLECVKQEFYRRVMVPYEENKARLNGDVYDPQPPMK